MSRIETESKYYCMEPEKFINYCEKIGLKLVDKEIENDEYFTDLDSAFIKNRTCLRIRSTDSDKMEITFKGKSLELLGQYSKVENNIEANILEYNNFVSLFSSLGYYSYVNVNKNRITYTLENSSFECNLMIDKLDEIGGFVEFEVISDRETYEKKLMEQELNNFVKMFSEFNLEEVNLPYRDIVAKKIYEKNILDKKKKIYIDVDHLIVKYEKEFYKKYKTEIEEILSETAKWGKFNYYDSIEIKKLMQEYFDNKIFDSNELLGIFKLIKNVDYKIYFMTKLNLSFYKIFLNKLGFDIDKYLVNKDELNKNELKESVILSGKLKSIVQMLLIITNMEG